MEHKLKLEDFRHGKYKYEPKPGELRLVQDNNMWGYTDDEGNVVILGQFHIACEFNSRDYAVVMKDGYYVVINKKTAVPKFLCVIEGLFFTVSLKNMQKSSAL